MTHKFLDKEIELVEFNIATADKIQAVMMGDSDIAGGNVKVGIETFNKAKYMTIEYGTKDKDINEAYLKSLPAKNQADVQALYEAIQKLNGL